ncbi:uncharacterized protein LOC121736037 isoform X1 [Aricia agestis]|uniref:uncharacterized protein LOC121736037 isoform X1 n=1 Tax=Aricia agestis TaxID=91739 RepID=UPI001C208E18|nr:uncharacterized protein LOC121736037 isoform X1 [Aricia agestis]XP_041983013.1 uncharacterized protein LOC121736037 isoform X1 [Aricia agestis]
MTPARCLFRGLVLLAVLIEVAHPICVLESDFGFKINCAFKKSGLFRVRNLGGVKAHASIGFSLGDELGFEQSLTNLDPSRRRSVSLKAGEPNLVDTTKPTVKQEKRGKQNRIMMRPMVQQSRPNQAAMDKLSTLHRRVASTMQPIVVAGPTVDMPVYARQQPGITIAKPMKMGVPAFKPLPPKDETLKVLPLATTKKTYTPLQLPQGPGIVYPSENTYVSNGVVQFKPMRISPMSSSHDSSRLTVNPFLPLPPNTISLIQSPAFAPNPHSSPADLSFVDTVPHRVHDLANTYPAYNTKKVDDYNTISGYSDDTTLKLDKDDINAKIAEIAKAGNISMEAVEAAIVLRQQQLLNKYANIATPTTTTTTEAPVFQLEPEPEIVVAPVPQKPKRNNNLTGAKVMNAPKEYYPVGYEKNFDDHFQSKVDLPETSFHCGDQKYFPGLYGDESLGCMVFHVCALTDDGLVMKSFLCPESTLFDQTILKCNWWFYVDCKNTVKLYDTNIPVSKSYQLMKALTFFSSYKKEMEEDKSQNGDVEQGVKEAITILENQDNKPAASNVETMFVTPLPVIDERHSNSKDYSSVVATDAPVYRGSRNFNQTEKVRRKPESQESLVTNASTNFYSISNNTSAESSEGSSKRKRQRLTYRRNSHSTTARTTIRPNTTEATTTTTTTTQEPTSQEPTRTEISVVTESQSQTDRPILSTLMTETMTQAKLIDEINNLDKIEATIPTETESSPVRRFYRSSAEVLPEFKTVGNEKVQIVMPSSRVRDYYPKESSRFKKHIDMSYDTPWRPITDRS